MAAITETKDGKKTMAQEEQSPAQEPQRPRAGGPRFFTIYKKGQGYWTRMGTAIGAALLGAMVAYELFDKLPTFMKGDPVRDRHISLVVALIFIVVYVVGAYWLTNKPSNVDFLIQTDSEMKKVNWTTRRELIGSTKVVILFMFLIALYLFACDLLFGGFFHLIHVVKTWF